MIAIVVLVAIFCGVWVDNRIDGWLGWSSGVGVRTEGAVRAAAQAARGEARQLRAEQKARAHQARAQHLAQVRAQLAAQPPAQSNWTTTRAGRTAVRAVRVGGGAGRAAGHVGAVGVEATRAGVRAVPKGWQEGRTAVRARRAQPTQPPAQPPVQPAQPPVAQPPAQPPAQPQPTQPPTQPAAPAQPVPAQPAQPTPPVQPPPATPAPPAPPAPPKGAPDMSGPIDFNGVKVPAEINDHATAVRTLRELEALFSDTTGLVKKAAEDFLGTLSAFIGVLGVVISLPDRIGPHIAKPLSGGFGETAGVAKAAQRPAIEVMDQMGSFLTALGPLAEATSQTAHTAIQAKGDEGPSGPGRATHGGHTSNVDFSGPTAAAEPVAVGGVTE
jgi:hypothetical protein